MTDFEKELVKARQKIAHLTSLLNASKALNSTLDIDELLNLIMSVARRDLDAERCTLFMVDHEKKEIWSRVVQDYALKEIRLPIGKGIAGHVAATGQVVNVADAYSHPAFCSDFDKASGFKTKSLLCVPMEKDGRIVGVIQALNKKSGIFTEDDEDYLTALASHAVLALDNALLYSEALEKRKMDREMEAAKEILIRLLPSGPPAIPGWKFAARSLPCQQVGGDYYDFIPLAGGRWGTAVADVSGKGLTAALIMANLQASLRLLAGAGRSPAELVAELNQFLFNYSPEDKFVTLFYGVLSPADASMIFVNAGHSPPFLIKKDGSYLRLETGDMVIGLFDGVSFSERKIEMEPGDLLFLFTDGLTDVISPDDEIYGEERLLNGINRFREKGTEGLIESVFKDVRSFVQAEGFTDDQTAVVMEVLGPYKPLELAIPESIDQLASVDRKVEEAARSVGFEKPQIDGICLAVHEAVANAILHGRSAEKDGRIRIRIDPRPDGISITVKDQGSWKGRKRAITKKRFSDPWASGGRGILLIKSYMDNVRFDISQEGTQVVMEKKLGGSERAQNPL